MTDPDIEASVAAWTTCGGNISLWDKAIENTEADPFHRWAFLWAEDGFFSLECGHKFAAALMCTTYTSEIEGDLLVPARAIRVAIPPGLLRSGEAEYRWAYLLLSSDSPSVFCLTQKRFQESGVDDGIMVTGPEGHHNATRCLFDRLSDEPPPKDLGPETFADFPTRKKLLELGRRLAIGLLYTLQYTTNFRERTYAVGAGVVTDRGPPRHRIVFVGRPIKVDARQQIAQWLGEAGGNRMPSIQHVVRGHYKRQVVGVARGGRKVIWVEPYWRGPEDAPILVHPYQVGP